MNRLELWRLRRYCDKHGIDYMEIDDTLTYWENKKHLRQLVRMFSRSLDVFELARWRELQEQYMKEHFLSFYLGCIEAGETISKEVGEPNPHGFSLIGYVNQNEFRRRHQNV